MSRLAIGTVRGRVGKRSVKARPAPAPVRPEELVPVKPGVEHASVQAATVAAKRAYVRETNRVPNVTASLVRQFVTRLHAVERVDPAHFVTFVCRALHESSGVEPHPGQVFTLKGLDPWLEEYRRRHASYFRYTPRGG